VTLPLIFPGILAGFLLSFTFSFDDFIIAFFVAGSETTLPIYVFSSIRRGVTPEINAIGTMVLAVSLLLVGGGATDPAARAEKGARGCCLTGGWRF
jgi:spermidine/putrescine transport system permease protein